MHPVYLFTPFLFYELDSAGVPLLPGVIIALIAAAGVGVINGFFTAIVGVNSFITTLGTLFAFEGLTLIISHAQPVATPGAQVTSTTVNVEPIVNGHRIVYGPVPDGPYPVQFEMTAVGSTVDVRSIQLAEYVEPL